MKILLTGANGFVGRSHTTELFKRNMPFITSSRSIVALSDDVMHFQASAVDGNTDWSQALVGIDVVIHLAARVHLMRDHAVDPLAEFLEVNLHGTANLALQAAKAGVKRFVYVSSIKVNGEYTEAGHAFDESSDAHPQDAYAISKWQAEQALHQISQETGMEVVIVRPPLVYGPGVKANFAKLLKLVDRGIPMPLGNVRNSRSLVYVGNLVDALIACASHPAAAGQTYLISDGEDVSTPQLIHALAEALHRPDRLFSLPINLMRRAASLVGKSAAVDRLTQSFVIDSSKIREELGWRPPYSMAQGLQATADWYRQSTNSANN